MPLPSGSTARLAGPGEATADAGAAAAPLVILAPTGRDGSVAGTVLGRAGFAVTVCADMDAVCARIDEDVGALIIAEEALGSAAWTALLAALDAQPAWSDIPVVVLTAERELSRLLSPTLRQVAARANVTLLERPVRVATLVTTLRSALRARQRQFDVRDNLAEREKAKRALELARAQAEDANRSKGEFLAVMSHELRTPLNAIGGYAELIEMGLHGPITDEQRDDLRRIQQSQRHLLGLINQVLNYTRVDTGNVHYDIAEIPVREALAAAEALVVPQLRAKHLSCTLGTCGADFVVHADGDKLQQILLNLLSNAIKFTSPGGRLRVDCARVGDAIAICVADTGIGIATDKVASVFEPFVQIDAKLTRAHEGVGLGLAISRDLARGMGGELSVESEVGVGSRFTLTLPAA